jgi:hypothetical protein
MSGGPLRQVLTAVDDGALTFDEMARVTGLSQDMITAALDQLLRMGHLRAESLNTGCPPAGCRSCGSAGADSGTCSAGPVLVGLSPARRSH